MTSKNPKTSTDKTGDIPVNAHLLTTPGCAHCVALKKILEKLLTEGKIGPLDITDVSDHPEIAGKYGVKSVPWLQLGSFQFQGRLTEKELRQWVDNCHSPDGNTRYMKHLLEHGELNQVIGRVREDPRQLVDLLSLVTDEEQDFKVRLGVSAVFEEFQGSDILQATLNELADLARHEKPQVRADAAHFLALSHSAAALPYLQRLAKDQDREVREIAEEALTPSSE